MSETSLPCPGDREEDVVRKPTRPVVSVIMPTYNTAPFIGQAICSVLRQTYADWELLIVDDGSEDNTPKVVAKYVEPRIRYFRTENLGAGHARNLGIAKARGAFVAFLDSDDVWFPHKLDVQLKVLRDEPDVGLTYSNYWLMSESGVRIGMQRFALDRLPIGWCLEDLLVRNGVLGGGSTVMIRRELLERVGPFDTALLIGQDWDLWLRLAVHCRFHYTPRALMAYRQREGSISTGGGGVLRTLFDYIIVERAFARQDVRRKYSEGRIAAIRRRAEAVRLYNGGSRLLRSDQSALAVKSFLQSCRVSLVNFRQIAMLFVSLAARLPLVNRRFLLKATRK